MDSEGHRWCHGNWGFRGSPKENYCPTNSSCQPTQAFPLYLGTSQVVQPSVEWFWKITYLSLISSSIICLFTISRYHHFDLPFAFVYADLYWIMFLFCCQRTESSLMETHEEWECDIKPLMFFSPSKLRAEATGNASQKTRYHMTLGSNCKNKHSCFMRLLSLHRGITTSTHVR